MDFLTDLGAGWLIGLVLGMVTGLVYSWLFLKE
jgi:Mg/Co/Ni transporter MgtE